MMMMMMIMKLPVRQCADDVISTWWCDQDTWGGLYSGLPIIALYTSFPPGHDDDDDEDYDDVE